MDGMASTTGIYFSTVLEAGVLEVKWVCKVRSRLPNSCVLTCRERELSGLFHQGTNPLHESPAFMSSNKDSSPNTITLEVRCQLTNFWRTHTVYNILPLTPLPPVFVLLM